MIKTYETNSSADFDDYVNDMLANGWKIDSTNCGFMNSENYDFASVFQAVLVFNDNK